jgi:hypothetical protein
MFNTLEKNFFALPLVFPGYDDFIFGLHLARDDIFIFFTEEGVRPVLLAISATLKSLDSLILRMILGIIVVLKVINHFLS